LPTGWSVKPSDLWLIEIFTPLDIPNLSRRLAELNGRTRGADAFKDYAEWLSTARQQDGISWTKIPTFASPDCQIFIPDKVTEELPRGVDAVMSSLWTVTSGISLLVMNFRYSDDFSSEMNELINHHYTAEIGRSRRGSYEIDGVEQQKARAVAKWRDNRTREAASWLSSHFQGFFARDAKVNMPAIELTLTTGFIPWDATRPRTINDPLRALGLSHDNSPYWKSDDFPELRARHAGRWTMGHEMSTETLHLSANEQALLGDTDDSRAEQLHRVRWATEQMAARWALNRLVLGSGQRFNRVRDDVTRAVERASFKAFIDLRNHLLQSGIDANLTVSEAVKFSNNAGHWNWELPKFSEVVPPHWGTPAVTLDEAWRQEQSSEAGRITEVEQHLRDVTSTAAELTNAAYNIRLQGRVFFLTIVSLIVSLVALWVSYVSLKQGG
jgi:hypothetical protein